MRVLFTSLRVPSHFLPLVPFIDACRRKDVEVAVAAPADIEALVKPTGATLFPFDHPGDAGLRPLWAKISGASDEQRGQIVFGEIFAGICASMALPGLMKTIADFRPSVIVRESAEFAGLIAAEKARIPCARVAITARSRGADIFQLAMPSLDAHRAAMGLELDPSGEHLRRETSFTLFPASMEDLDVAKGHVKRFRAARREAAPLPAYWPGREGPFVYVTLGTVMGNMDESKSLFGVVLEAVRDLPIRVLLTIGKDLPMDALGEVPANVHVERFVPQDDVMPHAAAVLFHGGSGTMLGAVAAGAPMVVVPMFADQPQNAERVAAVGAGVSLPKGGATPDGIRQALSRVLAEASFRDVARKLAAEMASLPLTDEIVTELEGLEGGR
jgi:UDP:flavonoid glycosyltransferase YjiC (YdhE family)